jgi:hypothetical protein
LRVFALPSPIFVAEGKGGGRYRTSQRWDKILRAKITSDDARGSPMLVTCWVGADGRASIVVKIDDGEP